MTDATSQHLTPTVPHPAEVAGASPAIRRAADRARIAAAVAGTRAGGAVEATKSWAARRSGIEPILPEQAASERWMGGPSR